MTQREKIYSSVIDWLVEKHQEPNIKNHIDNLPNEDKLNAILMLIGDSGLSYKNFIDGIKQQTYCGELADRNVKSVWDYVWDSSDIKTKEFGEVMTPITLVNEMLDKLPIGVWSNPNLKWLDPCNGVGTFAVVAHKRLMEGLSSYIEDPCDRSKHILENMIYVCELQDKNMILYMSLIDTEYNEDVDKIISLNNNINLYSESFLDKGFSEHMLNVWGIETFDIIMGNPPYNKPGTSNSGNTIWPKFVDLSLNLLSANGFLVMVHPPSWRKPESKLFEVMKLKKIHHISIHDVEDGKKVFGAQTRYDWYVLQNQLTDNFINVDCEDGNFILNLEQYPFIPNKKMNEILSIVSNENVCDVIYDRGSYPSEYIDTEKGREWMSKTQNETYQYPIINNINKKGTTCFYSSINNLGHFNVSKVIITTSNSEMNVLDIEGGYGMSKHIFGIKIDTEQEGKMIIKALSTDKFKKLSEGLIWGNYGIEWRVFKFIKKDFYKQFVDENGNEI
jgi:hypothetical protein